MPESTLRPKAGTRSIVILLFPIMTAVFVAFLVIGLALPVLPVHVHHTLGLGTFFVGLVAGAQSAAALVSRFWSGNFADSRGGKRAVITGLIVASAAGLLYLVSARFTGNPELSVTILLIGRGILGAAESFIITGSLTWGIMLAGSENSGRVIAWLGTSLYLAFAIGAPAGTALYALFGFIAIGLATTLFPVIALFFVIPRKFTPYPAPVRPAFVSVVRAVWMPGIAMAFSSLGFGAITTFIVLLFTGHGWALGWLALTAFALSFIVARLFFSQLADHIGGAKVAVIFALIETAGLLMIWIASSSWLALAGAIVTGFGYSLVYPGLGVEAIRRSPPENRGLAMGAFTAFLDLALGLANPAMGLLAKGFGLDAVFLLSAVFVIFSAVLAFRLMKSPVRNPASISGYY